MTPRQQRYLAYRAHALACPGFAQGRRCDDCLELDSAARVEDYRAAPAPRVPAGAGRAMGGR